MRNGDPRPSRAGTACPICGAAFAAPYQPFCSTRCADVDLGRWLSDRYAVPVGEDEEEADDTDGDPSLPGHGSSG